MRCRTLGLVLVMLYATLSWGGIKITRGYAVVNGRPLRELEKINLETLLFCENGCVLSSGDWELSLNVNGFARYRDLVIISQSQEEATEFSKLTGSAPVADTPPPKDSLHRPSSFPTDESRPDAPPREVPELKVSGNPPSSPAARESPVH